MEINEEKLIENISLALCETDANAKQVDFYKPGHIRRIVESEWRAWIPMAKEVIKKSGPDFTA